MNIHGAIAKDHVRRYHDELKSVSRHLKSLEDQCDKVTDQEARASILTYCHHAQQTIDRQSGELAKLVLFL